MNDTKPMTNKECAAVLRDKRNWYVRDTESALSFEVAAERAAAILEALPDSVSAVEMIEGHGKLQLTLFEAVLRIIALDGTLARSGRLPAAKQDVLAISRMIAMFMKTDHAPYRSRYRAAMERFVGGGGGDE